MPIMETEMAVAITEGTSQTIIWRLFKTRNEFSFNKNDIIELDLRNREEGINVDGFNGSNL